MIASGVPDQSIFEKWFQSLSSKDSALFNELQTRFRKRFATTETVTVDGAILETVREPTDADIRGLALETIVREGRPATPIHGESHFFPERSC